MKFFYDNFEPEQICGMFTAGHLFMIAISIVACILILHFSLRMTFEKIRRCSLILAITLCSIEVLKITFRIIKQQAPSVWVPLYFCSLFLYALWFSYSENEFIKKIGLSYIAMGGIIAAVTFCLYPSTSLAIYPLWHPESIYSYVYHIILFCSGVTILATGYYKPRAKDSVNYFIFISLAAIPSLILNALIDTNCLFLKDAYGLAFLPDIIEFSPVLYAVLAFLAQASALFWVAFGVIKLIEHINHKHLDNITPQSETAEETDKDELTV